MVAKRVVSCWKAKLANRCKKNLWRAGESRGSGRRSRIFWPNFAIYFSQAQFEAGDEERERERGKIEGLGEKQKPKVWSFSSSHTPPPGPLPPSNTSDPLFTFPFLLISLNTSNCTRESPDPVSPRQKEQKRIGKNANFLQGKFLLLNRKQKIQPWNTFQ